MPANPINARKVTFQQDFWMLSSMKTPFKRCWQKAVPRPLSCETIIKIRGASQLQKRQKKGTQRAAAMHFSHRLSKFQLLRVNFACAADVPNCLDLDQGFAIRLICLWRKGQARIKWQPPASEPP